MFKNRDLFNDDDDVDPLSNLPIESQLTYLQGWRRELTDELNEAQHRLHRISISGGDRVREEALEAVIADLQTRRADVEAKTLALDKMQSADASQSTTGLVRSRHANRDFFLADLLDYSLKDDNASMEAPLFTLSTKPDLSIWSWANAKGDKWVRVTPSVLGRATMHDKDILIYAISQLAEGLNIKRDDAEKRTVQFPAYDFLVTTNRGVGGDDYRRLEDSLDRLKGTVIKTNIVTGQIEQRGGFGLIEEWSTVKNLKTNETISVRITLSNWLFNAVQAFEILTIHPNYFRLRKPLARRLYEIGRKHCGRDKPSWPIGVDVLKDKCGSQASLKEFKRMLKAIAADNSLPEYRMELTGNQVVFFAVRLEKGAQKTK